MMYRFTTCVLLLVLMLAQGCGYKTIDTALQRVDWRYDTSVAQDMRTYFAKQSYMDSRWRVYLHDIQHIDRIVRYADPSDLSVTRINQMELRGQFQIMDGDSVVETGTIHQTGRYSEVVGTPYSGTRARSLLQEELWMRARNNILRRINVIKWDGGSVVTPDS